MDIFGYVLYVLHLLVIMNNLLHFSSQTFFPDLQLKCILFRGIKLYHLTDIRLQMDHVVFGPG